MNFESVWCQMCGHAQLVNEAPLSRVYDVCGVCGARIPRIHGTRAVARVYDGIGVEWSIFRIPQGYHLVPTHTDDGIPWTLEDGYIEDTLEDALRMLYDEYGA